MEETSNIGRRLTGGVDTHKNLHVACVVDERGQVLETQSFAILRQRYRQMVQWMRSWGDILRVVVESTGTYGAGLLRHLQAAVIEVSNVILPCKQDRRRRGKDDDFDAKNVAYAAFAGKRPVTPKTRDGMIQSLHVLKACRNTAIAGRKVALQLVQNTIICAPDELREPLRNMTCLQLIRTLAA